MLRCCFAGHRTAPQELLKDILIAVEKIVMLSERIEFYSGGMGEFDRLCERAVREIKRKYAEKEICLYLILPSYQYVYKNEEKQYLSELFDDIFVCDASDGSYYKSMIAKRNRWMIEQSDVMIAYVLHESGGAYSSLQYARKQNLEIIRI